MRHVIWFSLSCALAAVNIPARAETVVAVAFIHPEKFTGRRTIRRPRSQGRATRA